MGAGFPIDPTQGDAPIEEQLPSVPAQTEDVGPGITSDSPIVDAKPNLRRERSRRKSMRLDKEDIASRVVRYYEEDDIARSIERDIRLQLYAKYRGWTEGKSDPWEDSSDQMIPDMMTASLRMQDTLHNAVMSARPAVMTKALDKANAEKQRRVDNHLDYQFFIEQKGELAIGEMAESFINDPCMVVFIPWIKDQKKVIETRDVESFEPTDIPGEHFHDVLKATFQGMAFYMQDSEGWDWEVVADGAEPFTVKFYTTKNGAEMVIHKTVTIFDGPRVLVKSYDQVLTPPRSANLQPPSPSNPGGASHVIIVDYPTIDEIARLQRSGWYDLVTKQDIDELRPRNRDTGEDLEEQQKDIIAGHQEQRDVHDPSHRHMTLLTCYDRFDIDHDGLDEDVIFWVIKETKTLLRVRALTEMYPVDPPRRPFAEAAFLPVKGRRAGISLLEMMEGLHDFQKQVFDQMVDGASLAMMPFGFYRAGSSLKPETIRMGAGDLMPLNDPRNDIVFPNLSNAGTGIGINLISLVNQQSERLTLQGDIQSGRVPAGKSSALRTEGGLARLLEQGEARPERILRRFYMGLLEVFKQMHELNKHFLESEKVYRVSGILEPGEDPYGQTIKAEDFQGRFDFEFKANVQNAGRQALQQTLQQVMQIMFNPVAIQSGLSSPETMYRLTRDMVNSLGQDPDNYVNRPSPQAGKPTVLAEEALSAIMRGVMPDGMPHEGAEAHIQKIQKLLASPIRVDSGGGNMVSGKASELLGIDELEILKVYMQKVQELAQFEAQQKEQIDAARQGQRPNGKAGPPQRPQDKPTLVSGANEQLDESLPRGGAGQEP